MARYNQNGVWEQSIAACSNIVSRTTLNPSLAPALPAFSPTTPANSLPMGAIGVTLMLQCSQWTRRSS